MRKKILFCFFIFLQNSSLPSSTPDPASLATPPPFFSSTVATNFFFGQDLDVGITDPFDPYSLFQYIFDFGITLDKEPIRKTNQTISAVAKARMKGVLGDKGSGTFPLQEEKKFQIWMREACLQYFPTPHENTFLQAGIFPFKLGNGFVLGNAYNINLPISWEYLYEQIDQFRPAILLHVGNQKKSLSLDGYVGFIKEQGNLENSLSPTLDNLLTPLVENLDTAFTQEGTNDIVAAFQITMESIEPHNFHISPYLFFHKNNQCIEAPNDAISTLYTPGIYAFFNHNDIKFSVECAKNFGHQQVKALDRNLIPHTTDGLNSQLFYSPRLGSTLSNVTNADFVLSPFFITPSSLTADYGNGTAFLYQTDPGIPTVFKNSYDRFRKSYKNSYKGFMAYADMVVTKKNITWALAALYTSGGNNPNDSYDTILMTQLTPGVQYRDYNKNYKGFIGTDQFYEVDYINPLYYGTGDFNYTNLAFVGTTLEYSTKKKDNPFSAQITLVTYVKPCALIFNVTNAQGIAMNTPLPHYLGTELNYSASYTYNSHFTFSLSGGIFFPGSFYKASKQQLAILEADITTLFPSAGATPTPPITSSVKTPFFLAFKLVWLFDSCSSKELLV